jgi:hypothetical protein
METESYLSRYTAFFGRNADEILRPDPGVRGSCFAYRFPPTRVGFVARLFKSLPDVCVYITDGMSKSDMTIPPELQDTYPKRIELIACTRSPITGATDKQDVVIRLLQCLAGTVVQRQVLVGPGQTCDFGEKICPNTGMSGFFFGLPDGVDMRRLCRCTPAAELVVSVTPVTPGELALARKQGPRALVSAFEREGVPNMFDPFRRGVA